MPSYRTVNPYGNLYSYHSAQHLIAATDKTGARGNHASRNTLALVGNPELSRQLSEFGTVQLPTPHQWLTAIGQAKPKRVPSASSRRAKQGFKFWPQEKPQSSSELRALLSIQSQSYNLFQVQRGQLVPVGLFWELECHDFSYINCTQSYMNGVYIQTLPRPLPPFSRMGIWCPALPVYVCCMCCLVCQVSFLRLLSPLSTNLYIQLVCYTCVPCIYICPVLYYNA